MPLDEFTHYFSESKISTKQRKKLDDSQFGIPSLRKYPLTDEKHVLQAVRFFNKAPEEHKPELARNIVKRAKELNMDWEKWDVLKPYLDKPVKEAYAKELHSTPEADKICAYLCKSVKYDNASPKTWRLKSPDEVTDHNKGNCHDTAWYVFNNLDAYAKRKVGKGILFFIEYKEGKNEGGQTHSVCYEKIPGGICIIECSWEGMTGTFPYNDINEYISVVKNNWKFTGDNDKLYATEIKNTSQIHPGMTLSEYVFVAMKNKEIITESYGPDPDDGDHTSGTSDFDHDDNDPDDCYCESGNDASETQAFYKRWFDNKAKEDLKLAKDIAKRIHEKYEADQQPPCGNQNCMLCTMCAEAQFRGINVLPRPVYSPRDPVLNILGESIVKNPKHKSIKTGFDDMLDLATEPKDARWYCHVKWKDGHGGHEFLLLNINKHLYVMDPQQEIVTLNIESTYFNDVDYNESYICRLDKCELDEALLNKMNDPSQIVPWDAKLDIPYMLKEGMLSEEEAEQYWKEHPDERPDDRHFLSYKELDKMSESKNIFTSGDFAKYGKDVDLTDARGPIQESVMKEFDSLDKCFKYITDAIKKYEKNDSISFTFYDYTKEDMKPGTPMKEFEEWIISHGKTVNINKPIKEEYIMSDFERDPSVLQMILEAEAEENDEKGSNDDEKGDAIESTEISIEGESEIGSDVGDVQNEYNPEEVERLNKLINSEMSAVSEYFNAAKESKEPNLMRLYSDIGDEERFHLEQLIYAKSTITGEAYEPQDPKVKKEYQELLDMGMDEETAMTTAVDKVQLMPKEATEDMSEDEAADFEESFRLISATSLQTAVMLEAAIDTSDIALQISENSTAFLEQMIIMEEVDNLNTRQGQKDLGSKNPIVILIKAFVAIYGAIIGLARKARLAFQKIRLRDKRKWAWIKKHGIGAIFAKGVSFYFFSEKKNMYDVGEPMRYIGLIHSMNEDIIKSCNITTISPKKYDIDGYITKLTDTAKGTNREIQITPIAARNTEDGIRLLQGVSLMKTKVVLTQENTPILEEQFFGYTERNYAMIEKEGENTKNIRLSVNVYNQMSILLDALAALGSETKLVMEALNNQEGTQGTTYDKMPGVWKSAVRAISVMEKSVSKFNSAVAADVSEMIKVNNGLKEAMETADTTGDTSAVNQHKNDVAQQQKANADASKNKAEGNDTVATTRKMATK